jgi:hypothetical protein
MGPVLFLAERHHLQKLDVDVQGLQMTYRVLLKKFVLCNFEGSEIHVKK